MSLSQGPTSPHVGQMQAWVTGTVLAAPRPQLQAPQFMHEIELLTSTLFSVTHMSFPKAPISHWYLPYIERGLESLCIWLAQVAARTLAPMMGKLVIISILRVHIPHPAIHIQGHMGSAMPKRGAAESGKGREKNMKRTSLGPEWHSVGGHLPCNSQPS